MYISGSYANTNVSVRTPLTLAPKLEAAPMFETAPMGPTESFTASTSVDRAAAPVPTLAPAEAANAEVPTVDIKTVEDQLTANLPGVGVDFAHIDAFGKLNGRLTSVAELKEMMAALYDESNIPYGYITDGCYARAHMMDESLRQHGINNAKMFCKGDLEAKNDIMTARWWYHVAPLVFVDGGDGKPVPKIVDPGFSREPLDPEQWVKAMNQGPNVEIDLVSAEQYYPRRGRADSDFASSLGPSVNIAQEYSQELHGIKKRKGIPVGEYVKPTWDTPGSGGDYEAEGKIEFIFPEGIKAKPRRGFELHTSPTGALVFEPEQEAKAPVSAMWSNRPADAFDPYKNR